MYKIIPVLSFFLLTSTADANEWQHGHGSKYAGQEKRQIKSLSNADIAELRAGGGWGLAKAAELNGVPGPAHLLELQTQIPLTADQVRKITDIRNRMRNDAIRLGEELIGQEARLERRFQHGHLSPSDLRKILEKIGEVRASLRFVHLRAHLESSPLLTKPQIERYNDLRGYN